MESQRSTTRTNAGKPPSRFGFHHVSVPNTANIQSVTSTASHSQRRKSTSASSAAGSTSRSVVTHRSSMSHSSTVRQSEIDLQTESEIDTLEEQYDNNEREVENKEIEIKTLIDTLNDMNNEVEYGDDQSEGVLSNLKEEITKNQTLLSILQKEVEKKRVDLKFELKSIQRKKLKLRREAEHQKQLVDEEDNENEDNLSQHLSSGDEEENFSKQQEELQQRLSIQMKIAATSLQAVKDATIPNHEHPSGLLDDDELLQRLRNLQDPYTAGAVPTSTRGVTFQESENFKNNPTSASLTPPDSIADQFATAITKAFEKLAGNSNNTEKFLARQVQGKDLPIFSGRPEEWSTFITAFENSTLGCGYSNQDNLPRLQKCLRGEAVKTVQCLLARSENVPAILTKLKMRFGRPEHIVQILIGKAIDIPTFKENRLDMLIEFGLAVDNLVKTIKALRCLEHLTSPQLLEEFSKKLPVSLRTKWIEWVTSDPSRKENIEDFAKWMNIQTEVACKLCPPKWKEEAPKRQWEQGRPRRKEEKVWAVAESSTPSKKPRFNPKLQSCSYCEGNGHKILQCRRFEKESLEEKRKWVRTNRHCFGCLKYGHSIKDCRSKKECGKEGCVKEHHPLLHIDELQHPAPPAVDVLPQNQKIAHAVDTSNNSNINLLILPVRLRGPKGEISTFAMLDPGATCTVLSEEIASQLGLVGPYKPFIHSGLHQLITKEGSRSVSLEILNMQGDKKFSLQNVRTKKHMAIPGHSVRRNLIQKWKHLRDLPIEQYIQGQPTILIGLDNFRLSCTSELRLGPGNAPAAGKTELGWVLLGSSDDVNRSEQSYMVYGHMDEELHQLVKYHFTTESIGVQATTTTPRSKDDITAQQIMDSTIKRVGEQWESGLLWKNEDVDLPSTKQMAFSRLLQMERKMDRDPNFAQQYIAKIQEYEDKGFAYKLTPEQAKVEGPLTFYLPHFMAKNPKKPKKLRFVFDAAAKVNNISLNDALLKGPDKLTSLPSVLFKFRQRCIALTADIKDMFHRVKIRKEDAGAQRFLWRGMERNRDPDVWEMGVLIFGAACSPACAQEVKNRNALEHEEQYPEAVRAIITRHYVDDYLDSVDTVQEGMELFETIRKIHLKGGFNLCNWISNSKELLSTIPAELYAPGVKSMDLESDAERVLGLFWMPETDEFTFSMNFLKTKEELMNGERLPTKRELLALVMSIYDPLGFLSHLTVKARIILQETWRIGIGWEDEISVGLKEKWDRWNDELKQIDTFKLSRCYSSLYSTATIVQVHVFVDASLQAYGAVVYFRIQKEDQVTVSFVTSKARVAPTKSLTVPRLELQAALIGSRLAKFVKNEHEILTHRTIYWSDSSTVLTWLRTEKRRPSQFVSCRVGEILENTEVSEWKWIPTKLNVADELTRDNQPSEWDSKSRWVTGPDFLKEAEDKWPSEDKSKTPAMEEELEWQKDFIHATWEDHPLVDIQKYSSLNRITRIIAYVLRFIRKCRKDPSVRSLQLHPWEIEKANQWWWKTSQIESFQEEIQNLLNNGKLQKSSRFRKLNPIFVENGILRIAGRIDNACVPEYTKRPVILDSRHKYTQLLIAQYHEEGGHHGQEKIANELRQKYHILNLRGAVRKCWKTCQKCQNENAVPIIPQMGQLPSYRVESYVSPFHNTGLDFFGPITVTVGRRHEKRWGALFTCLSTRAVHVEMTSSLSTDSCIMAIRRFVARRGCPSNIHSDNGTNLVGANNELKKSLQEIDQEAMIEACTIRGITWHFIPPSAPHMGGSWERLVRSIKVALFAVLKERHPRDEVLNTLMVEAEHIVNSHPLTHVPIDPDDPEALTPNHFLIGRSSNVQAPGKFDDADLCLRKQWRQAQRLVDQFWKRWIREYLPTLVRRGKWFKLTESIKLDDVVLVIDDQLPRNSWPMGLVTKLYPGKDGIVRVVDVKTGTGVYKRSVSKLCKLDVRRKQEDSGESNQIILSTAPMKAPIKDCERCSDNTSGRMSPQQ